MYSFIKKILTYEHNNIKNIYFSLSLVIQLENLCKVHILLIINQFCIHFELNQILINSLRQKDIIEEAAQLIERSGNNN